MGFKVIWYLTRSVPEQKGFLYVYKLTEVVLYEYGVAVWMMSISRTKTKKPLIYCGNEKDQSVNVWVQTNTLEGEKQLLRMKYV